MTERNRQTDGQRHRDPDKETEAERQIHGDRERKTK